jgi:hypothetical protein
VYFHQLGFRNFKGYHLLYVCRHLGAEFPKLLSYTRFVQLMPHLITPMWQYPNAIDTKQKIFHPHINL